MNLEKMAEKYRDAGYSERNADARVCQDIVQGDLFPNAVKLGIIVGKKIVNVVVKTDFSLII